MNEPASRTSPAGQDKASALAVDQPPPAAGPAEPLALQLAGVTKRYGAVAAVEGVELSVRPGEFIVLLGPSGSGKTTLLNLIAGFVDNDAGAILLGGRDISNMPPHKRDIGVVFQSYALFPHLSVAKNVAFPLAMRQFSKRQIAQEVEEALRLVGLEGFGHRMPQSLSGGQQQRVALARALVFKPPLLLMDEPMAALDRVLRERLQRELKHLQRSLGLTVCYVTHDQHEAFLLADRIGIMNGGKLAQVAAPDELYNQPGSSFVASFVGDTNLLDGQATAEDGEVSFRCDGLSARVTSDGPRHPAEIPGPGRDARLSIRPHLVAVGFGGQPVGPPATHVSLPGTVTDCEFRGPDLRVTVRVDLLSRDIVSLCGPEHRAAATSGSAVQVGWRHSDALLLLE
jgi:ABC-type Fe3+/spermidine/putrescine transport system ATPase subunit